jgi:hypothetical protein
MPSTAVAVGASGEAAVRQAGIDRNTSKYMERRARSG